MSWLHSVSGTRAAGPRNPRSTHPPMQAVRQRSFVIPAVIVGVLIVLAVGVYAYDSSRDDQIAKGVTVGGIDVGGMQADKARQKLSSEMGQSLKRSIEVSLRH